MGKEIPQELGLTDLTDRAPKGRPQDLKIE